MRRTGIVDHDRLMAGALDGAAGDRDSGEAVGAYAIGQGTTTDAASSNDDTGFVSSDFMADAQSQPQVMPNPPPVDAIGGLELIDGGTIGGALSTLAMPVSGPGNPRHRARQPGHPGRRAGGRIQPGLAGRPFVSVAAIATR